MTTKFDELKAKLREIFQLDKPELDFGIYRILHTRKAEIDNFLDIGLSEKVKVAISGNTSAEKAILEKELKEKSNALKSMGVDPDTAPAIKELKQKIANLGSDIDAEISVYSHLLAFFSRYYDKGDFLSKRRYKDGVYVIPYSGEEVKLYWTNSDQYYIKSSENFTNYNFRLKNGNKVHFSLVAAEVNKDDIKNTDAVNCFVVWNPIDKGKIKDKELVERLPDKILEEKDGELYIYFQYLKFKKSKDINQSNFTKAAKDKIYEELKAERLYEKYNLFSLAESEKEKTKTILDKHLDTYTIKNTSDYFIHKNLKEFLERELDFYIKNEMMHLDDVQSASSFKDIERNLKLIQTFKIIATELISFMSQLEEFQKKIWLKRKFVIQSEYCITLDRIPKELHAKVFENKAQLAEWEKLGFSNINQSSIKDRCREKTRQSNQTELEFELQGQQPPLDYRMVDTKFYDEEFKSELLKSIPALDEQIDGLLIHSENFQALNLIQKKYDSQIKCIYIDPPYNTGNDGFLYKDGYQHSSWLSMLNDRLRIARKFMNEKGIIFISIDDCEQDNLIKLCDLVLDESNRLYNLSVVNSLNGNDNSSGMMETQERCLIYAKNKRKTQIGVLPLDEEETDEWLKDDFGFWKEGRGLKATGINGPREARPQLFFPIYINEKTLEFSLDEKSGSDWYCLIPITDGKEMRWYWSKDKFESDRNEVIVKKTSEGYSLYKKQRPALGDLPSKRGKTTFYSPKYSGSNSNAEIKSLFNKKIFDYPKSSFLIKDFMSLSDLSSDEFVIDFFAGSGTTAHALISLNREDKEQRKYILIEMGEHFDTVLKPRIEKLIYSRDWKEGKPLNTSTGISHCFKYLTLESYEDALNNIELESKGDLLEGDKKDEYLLSYMLDIESKESIINTDDFKHPFDYSLKIAIDSSGASEKQKVDLVETFNYLIGLRVAQYVRQIDKGYCFLDGTLPSGEKAFVMWRDCEQVSNDDLNKLLAKFGIKPGANEYDVIYVNGDHAVANVKLGVEEGKILKVRQIENEFLEKMFAETK